MTEMLITEATIEAVDHILANLWERGREELAILDVSNDHARSVINGQVARGAPTMAIWIDGSPVVMLGLMPSDLPRGMKTWFQATDTFVHYARPITLELRRAMENAAKERGLDFIEIFSVCVHPSAGRWFRALGFELDVDRHIAVSVENPRRLYRFVRTFKREG